MEKRSSILITGAAGAIGRATSQALSAQGHRVYLADRDTAGVGKLAAATPGATALTIDATSAESVANAFRHFEDERLDALVLAAGCEGPVGPLEDCADDAFDTTMTQNVKSVWLGLKHGLRVMKRQRGGSIVALASIAGVMASPLLSPYSASKHAVVGLVRSAAREAAAFDVRVNAVCPGPVDSPMMRRIDDALRSNFPERLGGKVDASHALPLKRYAKPEEVAGAIAFLCSSASSYCTGATFMVDGGIYSR